MKIIGSCAVNLLLLLLPYSFFAYPIEEGDLSQSEVGNGFEKDSKRSVNDEVGRGAQEDEEGKDDRDKYQITEDGDIGSRQALAESSSGLRELLRAEERDADDSTAYSDVEKRRKKGRKWGRKKNKWGKGKKKGGKKKCKGRKNRCKGRKGKNKSQGQNSNWDDVIPDIVSGGTDEEGEQQQQQQLNDAVPAEQVDTESYEKTTADNKSQQMEPQT